MKPIPKVDNAQDLALLLLLLASVAKAQGTKFVFGAFGMACPEDEVETLTNLVEQINDQIIMFPGGPAPDEYIDAVEVRVAVGGHGPTHSVN